MTIIREWSLPVLCAAAIFLLAACEGGLLPAGINTLEATETVELERAGRRPAITLVPSSGGADTVVTVSGTGFPADAEVFIQISSPDGGLALVDFGSVMADGDGRFSAELDGPGDWLSSECSGEQVMTIGVSSADGSIQAAEDFVYLPARAVCMTLDPTAGVPGDSIQVMGRGFLPGASVQLFLDVPQRGLSSASLAEAMADQEGAFAVVLTIPENWPGTQQPVVEPELIFTATDKVQGVRATVTFFNIEAFPSLEIVPSSGVAGQEVEAIGRGFVPGTSISLRLGLPQTGLDQHNLAEVVTDEQGTFAAKLTIPAVWLDTQTSVIEPELVIAAVSETDEMLATAIFENHAAGIPASGSQP